MRRRLRAIELGNRKRISIRDWDDWWRRSDSLVELVVTASFLRRPNLISQLFSLVLAFFLLLFTFFRLRVAALGYRQFDSIAR